MKKIIFILISACATIGYSQDTHFIQTSMTPIVINPGATGVFPGWERVAISHRQQWFSIGTPYMTTQLSLDLNLFREVQNTQKAYMGIGINFYNDQAGDAKFGTNQGSILLSGVVNLTQDMTLSAGIELGAAQQSINFGSLKWGSQFNGEEFDTSIDPVESNGATSVVYPDMGAGIYYNFQNITNTLSRKEVQRLYAGVSYYHLSQPQRIFYSGATDRLERKLIANIGGEVDIPGTKFVVAPSFAYFLQGAHQMMVGTLAAKARIKEGTKYTGIYNNTYLTFGLNYRNKDAVAPMVGIEIANYKFFATYEFNISHLQASTNSQGSFEISFQWANFQTAMFQGRRTKGYKKPGGM